MIQTPKLYALLHVADNVRKAPRGVGNQTPIDVYLRCGATLAASCEHFGVPFAIITNDADFIGRRLSELGLTISLVEREFNLDVPAGADFYSAHFKLELYRAFGDGDFGPLCGLIDIDTVLINPIPPMDLAPREVVVYSIIDQVKCRYSTETIRGSVAALIGDAEAEAEWWGGELILGSLGSSCKCNTHRP